MCVCEREKWGRDDDYGSKKHLTLKTFHPLRRLFPYRSSVWESSVCMRDQSNLCSFFLQSGFNYYLGFDLRPLDPWHWFHRMASDSDHIRLHPPYRALFFFFFLPALIFLIFSAFSISSSICSFWFVLGPTSLFKLFFSVTTHTHTHTLGRLGVSSHLQADWSSFGHIFVSPWSEQARSSRIVIVLFMRSFVRIKLFYLSFITFILFIVFILFKELW